MTDNNWESTPFPRYTPTQETEILRKSPTADVARELGVTVTKREDGTFVGACPWCRTAAFHIAADQGWLCYNCTEQGRDAVILVCKMRDLWRADALQWLANRAGLHLPPQRVTDVSIHQVRLASDFETVIRESGRHILARADEPATRCPHCDDSSCRVDLAQKLFYCPACQQGGDVISWVEVVDHRDFQEAVEYLAGLFGVTVIYEDSE